VLPTEEGHTVAANVVESQGTRGGTRVLGWGVLGCGDITEKRVAPAIRAQAESRFVAFCSRDRERARVFADRFGAPRAYSDEAALMADPEVQVVYVATEHDRHVAPTVAAAAAGKHVLCEKPMALDAAGCRAMIDACRAAGVFLSVAYYRRYYPKVRRMKALIDDGAIGEPVHAGICLGGRLDPGRIRPGDWRLQAERSGGGALADTGSHRLDLLCYLLGEPERVAGFMDRAELPIGAPDQESLLIRMKNGAHVVSRHTLRAGGPDEWEVYGTRGALIATPMDGDELVVRIGGETRVERLSRHENVHFPLIDDFARRVARGLPPEFDGAAGMQATRIIDAARESAHSGRVVILE
jgi:1,5-anhydro-D-fructose reductase (1,5-anhydro-D-mannitol-forming)